MKLVITNKAEQNDNADINNCSNGGGYFQPFIEGKIYLKKTTLRFLLNDTSCGEFGNRFEFSIKEESKNIYLNSVDEIGNDYQDTFWNREYENILDYLLSNSFDGIYFGKLMELHCIFEKSILLKQCKSGTSYISETCA